MSYGYEGNYKMAEKQTLREICKNSEKERSDYIYRCNMYCVQAHAFDDQFEKANLSIFEYLIQKKHLLLTITETKKFLEYRDSGNAIWHLKSGLKLEVSKLNL